MSEAPAEVMRVFDFLLTHLGKDGGTLSQTALDVHQETLQMAIQKVKSQAGLNPYE